MTENEDNNEGEGFDFSKWQIKFPSKVLPTLEPEHRVVDLYDRKTVTDHLSRYAQHCAARRVDPTLEVLLDYLYSTKKPTERDDFIKIERIIEMMKNNQIYPIIIMEVLMYALNVEKAAMEVTDELYDKVDEYKSLKKLKDVLDIRLQIRADEEEQKRKEAQAASAKTNNGNNMMQDFVQKLQSR